MFDSHEHKLVKQFLDEITAVPLDRYLHRDLPDTLNFTGRTDAMRTVLDFCQAAARIDLTIVPAQVIEPIRQRLEQLRNAFRNILAFTVQGGGDPVERRNQLMQAMVAAYAGFFSALSGICGHELYRATVADDLRAQVRAQVDAITGARERAVTEIDALRQRIEGEAANILAAARTSAMHATLATHASHFDGQARTHRLIAGGWLAATVAMGGVLTWVVWALYHKEPVAGIDALMLAQQLGKNALAISAVTFGVVWAARNYRANLHNWVVNSHRRNALQTFEALAKAVGDDPVAKNAILLKSAEAIFSPMPSGFVAADHDGGGSSHILEIIKAAKE